MVEITEAATVTELAWIRKQPARHDASAFNHLIGVGEIHIKAFFDARRTQCGFPSVNAGTFDGQRKENIRISKNVVIEEIPRLGLEVGEVRSEGRGVGKGCRVG